MPLRRVRYGSDRTLVNVTYPKDDMTLLTVVYKNDLLATTTAQTGVTTGYTYSTVGDEVVLWKVSASFTAGETPTDSYVDSYAKGVPHPALSKIAITAGGKWQKSTVEYAGGRLSAVQAGTACGRKWARSRANRFRHDSCLDRSKAPQMRHASGGSVECCGSSNEHNGSPLPR